MASTLAFAGSWVNHGFVTAAGAQAGADPRTPALLIIGVLVVVVLLLQARINSLRQERSAPPVVVRVSDERSKATWPVIITVVFAILAIMAWLLG
ncbi:hypothetical protein [Dactylosporangium sp. NPDC051541]|uniref:hypothetical protein n=1 Tax=Dactylosporangium sp. NPDC051541 TaxID=3363977 RepID=UPI00378DA465